MKLSAVSDIYGFYIDFIDMILRKCFVQRVIDIQFIEEKKESHGKTDENACGGKKNGAITNKRKEKTPDNWIKKYE